MEETNKRSSRKGGRDPEAGSPVEAAEGGEGEAGEEGEDGKVEKKETVVLRLGEGKLTGPMRFITCYASAFTFVVMLGIIVWLLMISPPFNVTPEILPEDMYEHIPLHKRSTTSTTSTTTTTSSTTTVLPPDTQEPEFSDDFHQA